jgi:hypothetical protein
MGLPAVNLNVLDNGLAQALPGNGNTEYVIGCASQGPYFQIVNSTNPGAFSAQNGAGPGVELAGFIANSTGNAVAFVAVPGSGATNTGMVASIPGNSTSKANITGTPFDTYYGLVKVLTGGTLGTGPIQVSVSLDGGRTTYAVYNLGVGFSVAIASTGLTLSFSAGTLVTGDSFSWVSTEPVWTSAQVASAINLLLPIPTLLPEDIIIAGGSAQRLGAGTVGAAAADVTALDGFLTTLFNKRRFNRGLLHAGDASYGGNAQTPWGGASAETEVAWISSLQTAFANASSLRVGVTGGHYNAISPYSQTQFRRPLLWQAAARDSAVAIQVDLGRVSDGALANMPLPASPDGWIYHDDFVNPGLDASRFMAAMSIANRPGVFIANPNLMAPPGSDFNWLQRGHVVDAACLIAYNFFVTKLSSGVRVGTNGFILPQDAKTFEQACNVQLANGLTNAGAVSSALCQVSRTDAILTTATLTVTVTIVPLGYLKAINVTITFQNPATIQVTTSQTGP